MDKTDVHKLKDEVRRRLLEVRLENVLAIGVCGSLARGYDFKRIIDAAQNEGLVLKKKGKRSLWGMNKIELGKLIDIRL